VSSSDHIIVDTLFHTSIKGEYPHQGIVDVRRLSL